MPVDRSPEWGCRTKDLVLAMRRHFARGEQENHLTARQVDRDDHAWLNFSVIGRSVPNFGVTQQMLKALDFCFLLRLLFARRVITAVFFQVTFLPGVFDALGNFGALNRT